MNNYYNNNKSFDEIIGMFTSDVMREAADHRRQTKGRKISKYCTMT